jgi:hypothetical protein
MKRSPFVVQAFSLPLKTSRLKARTTTQKLDNPRRSPDTDTRTRPPRCLQSLYNLPALIHTMVTRGTKAHLYLNEKNVGVVVVKQCDHSWTFGEFTPSPEFGEFAPLFGQWSLLMHADGDEEPLSPAAAEELREAENALARIHARIFLPETQEWRCPAEVNIDGTLIEWKEM